MLVTQHVEAFTRQFEPQSSRFEIRGLKYKGLTLIGIARRDDYPDCEPLAAWNEALSNLYIFV